MPTEASARQTRAPASREGPQEVSAPEVEPALAEAGALLVAARAGEPLGAEAVSVAAPRWVEQGGSRDVPPSTAGAVVSAPPGFGVSTIARRRRTSSSTLRATVRTRSTP